MKGSLSSNATSREERYGLWRRRSGKWNRERKLLYRQKPRLSFEWTTWIINISSERAFAGQRKTEHSRISLLHQYNNNKPTPNLLFLSSPRVFNPTTLVCLSSLSLRFSLQTWCLSSVVSNCVYIVLLMLDKFCSVWLWWGKAMYECDVASLTGLSRRKRTTGRSPLHSSHITSKTKVNKDKCNSSILQCCLQ